MILNYELLRIFLYIDYLVREIPLNRQISIFIYLVIILIMHQQSKQKNNFTEPQLHPKIQQDPPLTTTTESPKKVVISFTNKPPPISSSQPIIENHQIQQPNQNNPLSHPSINNHHYSNHNSNLNSNQNEELDEMTFLEQKAKLQLFEQSEDRHFFSQYILQNQKKRITRSKYSRSLESVKNWQIQNKKNQQNIASIPPQYKANMPRKMESTTKLQTSRKQKPNNIIFWRKRHSRNKKYQQFMSPPIQNFNLIFSKQSNNQSLQHQLVISQMLHQKSSTKMIKQSKNFSKYITTGMKQHDGQVKESKSIRKNNMKLKKKADSNHFLKRRAEQIHNNAHSPSSLPSQPQPYASSFTINCKHISQPNAEQTNYYPLHKMNHKASEYIHPKKPFNHLQKNKLITRHQLRFKTQSFKQFPQNSIFLSQNHFSDVEALEISQIQLKHEGFKPSSYSIKKIKNQNIIINSIQNLHNNRISNSQQQQQHQLVNNKSSLKKIEQLQSFEILSTQLFNRQLKQNNQKLKLKVVTINKIDEDIIKNKKMGIINSIKSIIQNKDQSKKIFNLFNNQHQQRQKYTLIENRPLQLNQQV